MSCGYTRFKGFITTPKKGQTLREFVDQECNARAWQLADLIEGTAKGEANSVSIEVVKAMPVNLLVYISNYSLERNSGRAPPVAYNRLGRKVVADEEYSFYGEYGDWLVHISSRYYGWIGDLEYDNWELYGPDLIAYDNYDYEGGDLGEDE